MDELTDGELLSRSAAGDPDAFAALVDRHRNPLVNYLTHVCLDYGRAEEIAQEAFVKLYRTAGRYSDRSSLAPLIFRIATNHYRSEERRSRRWSRLLTLVSRNDPPVASPQKILLQDEAQRKVSEAMGRLPVPYRAALVLREIEGWSHQQVAEALGCRVGTVKSRISRGRELLRQMLAPYWNGEEHETGHREALEVAPAERRIS
jgi:RNA polymerase sigma-70 factor (ECF subfamily)